MKKEMDLTFTGNNKDEAYKALEKIMKFVFKKPKHQDYYRFVYISIHDTNDIENNVNAGVWFKDKNGYSDLEKAFKDGHKVIDNCENFKRFYISGTVKIEK